MKYFLVELNVPDFQGHVFALLARVEMASGLAAAFAVFLVEAAPLGLHLGQPRLVLYPGFIFQQRIFKLAV